MNSENVGDITQPMYMLLPICTESEHDIFFNILQKVIARSRLDEHPLDKALKLGMMVDDFHIELDDITENWNQLKSDEQQTRQWKILGYWATENFPLLGKKFCGGSWMPPQSRGSLQIIGQPKKMSADEIDGIVFRKLKLRMMKLQLSKSTLDKLKHFIINVPPYIETYNELQMTKKIACLDIGEKWIQHCWNALKMGKFSLDDDIQVS